MQRCAPMSVPRRPLLAPLLGLALLAPGCGDDDSAAGAHSDLTVYAASSLREALPALDDRPRYSFGGSGKLQLQIERGAPADLFLSASPKEPRDLHRAGRCAQPVDFAFNRLVLIVPRGGRLRSVEALAESRRRVAIGSESVPIGAYTRRLLARLRLGSILRTNTVSSEPDVAAITAKVALGSADAGFVYVTDAKAAGSRVRVIALAARGQPTVRYRGCVVRRSAAAQDFLAELRGDRGRATLRRLGFGLPPR